MSATVYLVERTAFGASEGWDGQAAAGFERSSSESGDSYVPVRAFGDEGAAEACRRELEAQARRDFCPALFVGDNVEDLEPLAKLCRKHGVEPPKFVDPSYEHAQQFRRWYAERHADIPAALAAELWDHLGDELHFYRVREVPLES